jgi:hypothetical protein
MCLAIMSRHVSMTTSVAGNASEAAGVLSLNQLGPQLGWWVKNYRAVARCAAVMPSVRNHLLSNRLRRYCRRPLREISGE